MIDIVKRRYLYFGISLLVIVPGMLALLVWGLPLAIDFKGGSLLDIRFDTGTVPQPAQVTALYDENGFRDSIVQTSGTNGLVIRSVVMTDAQRDQLISQMETKFSSTITINRFESVGPSVGQEVTKSASIAVAAAAVI